MSLVSTYFFTKAAKNVSPAPEVSFTSTEETGKSSPSCSEPYGPRVIISFSFKFLVRVRLVLSYSLLLIFIKRNSLHHSPKIFFVSRKPNYVTLTLFAKYELIKTPYYNPILLWHHIFQNPFFAKYPN